MFWSLFIFHGNSVREPASSRVTYFILQAFKGTKPIKEPVLAKPNIVTIYLLVIHSTLYTKGLFFSLKPQLRPYPPKHKPSKTITHVLEPIYILWALLHRNLHPLSATEQEDLFYSTGPHRNYCYCVSHSPHRKKTRRGFGKNAGEWTIKVFKLAGKKSLAVGTACFGTHLYSAGTLAQEPASFVCNREQGDLFYSAGPHRNQC